MAKILLADYAKLKGKDPTTVLEKIYRGSLQTAEKIGRQWFIDENEEYPDLRVKSGKYVGKTRSRKTKTKTEI